MAPCMLLAPLQHREADHQVFDVNIHAFFYVTRALLPLMPWGSSIINNASIVRVWCRTNEIWS